MYLNQDMALSDKDIKALDDLIDQKIEEKAETTLATKADIKHLPTKADFYDQSDKLMTELKATREDITTLSGLQSQVHDHEIRIHKVEKKLNISPSI
jgi:hypothetical protein